MACGKMYCKVKGAGELLRQWQLQILVHYCASKVYGSVSGRLQISTQGVLVFGVGHNTVRGQGKECLCGKELRFSLFSSACLLSEDDMTCNAFLSRSFRL